VITGHNEQSVRRQIQSFENGFKSSACAFVLRFKPPVGDIASETDKVHLPSGLNPT